MIRYYSIVILLFSLYFIPICSWASCDCGSTDSENPCTGQAISVTVPAGTPNGGVAYDSVFNWSFNSGGGDALCGQFANGDYWIAPAPGQTDVTITTIATTSPGTISADADPIVESTGLLSASKDYGNYSAEENIVSTLPLTYAGTNSLVAVIQRNEAIEGDCGTSAIVGSCANAYNVVTVLSAVPENAGSTVIRPNITGESKDLISLSDFDFSRLPKESFLTGTDTAGLEEIRRKWSHSIEMFSLYNSVGSSGGYCSEGGRAYRSHTLIDDYGGGAAATWYSDMMTLFSSDNTLAEKQPALAAMLSYGLDLYHARYDSPAGMDRNWGSGATQHPGKFIASAFMAALYNDTSFATTLKTASEHLHDTQDSGPHELSQVHVLKGVPLWGDEVFADMEEGAYWDSLWKSQCYDGAEGTCATAIGKKAGRDPYGYIDGTPNKPGTGYFTSSLGGQRALVAVAILMPEIEAIINYSPLFDYVLRSTDHGIITAPDPCVTPDSREIIDGSCDPYRNSGCNYYGVTWGPDPDNPGECIKTATPPYTQEGRFTSIDGTPAGASYTSGQVESNWGTITSLWSSRAHRFKAFLSFGTITGQ